MPAGAPSMRSPLSLASSSSIGHDAAERNLPHHAASGYKEAFEYQRACKTLGQSPFDDAELERLRRTRDELAGRYGEGFLKDWG